MTITDLFCGAGGSSQGASLAHNDINIKLALNHWQRAIDTHQANFPNALHEQTDISACEPRRYPKTDILLASPECTNHSLAKGKKRVKETLELFDKGILDPSAERSRATMWDVVRFAEVHQYKAIVVENVVDARRWVLFDSWLSAMQALGYQHQCVYLNSMHAHPTPQSRDRMYVVFVRNGMRMPDLNFRPRAHCGKCGIVESVLSWKRSDVRVGKYRQQYVYRCPVCANQVEPFYHAAFNIIDWSNKGKRIGDRSKPLAPATLERIRYGINKYANTNLIVTTRYSSGIDCRVRTVADVLPTQPGDASHTLVSPAFTVQIAHTKAGGNHHGLVTTEAWNSFISYQYSNHQASHVSEALATVATKDKAMLVSHRENVNIEDCYYRMLTSAEIGRAMAFADDYIVTGNEKERIKQYGNAVTPPAMRDIVQRIAEVM